MRIWVVRWQQSVREAADGYPRLILERGRYWSDRAADDASYETLFDVYLDEAPGQRRLLGSTKILQRGALRVELARELDALPLDCCSLGQTIDYYSNIESLGQPVCDELLTSLRDVTANLELGPQFELEQGFSVSLTRFSEAARIYHFRHLRLHRERPQTEPFRLEFEASLPGFSGAPEHRHKVAFSFRSEPGAVGRLAAIVGNNGTGKTQFLARLAAAVWGLRRHDSEVLRIEGPPPGRVIAISYSPLDAFERPPHFLSGDEGGENRPAMAGYTYCGFRDQVGDIRPRLLFSSFRADLLAIQALGRMPAWSAMVETTKLGDHDAAFQDACAHLDVEQLAQVTEYLGAGQKTALTVLTRILSVMRNGALVLMDEPELNLHPSLLASLLRVLHDWLDEFDGYGIIATHSPIGLQEIPGRNVRIFHRFGMVPVVREYPAESFGQSIAEIVDEVFGVDERNINYVTVLRKLLASGLTADAIEGALGRPLSLGARMALQALSQVGPRDA